MNSVAAEMTIVGLVQGVGYRYFVLTRARELGLSGWVRNNRDGSVSVRAEGDRSLIEELIGQLRTGPPMARVTDLAVTWLPFEKQNRDFEIVRV